MRPRNSNPYRQTGIRSNGNIPGCVVWLFVVTHLVLGAIIALLAIMIAKGGI